MNDRFSSYLKAIRAGEPIIERADMMLDTMTVLSPEPIDRIFLCDRIDETSGDRLFTSLWGFSTKFALESEQFLAEDGCDIAPYAGSVLRLNLSIENFRLDAARGRKDARLAAHIGFGTSIHGTFSATGPNCVYLASLLREVFVPNVRESQL